MTESRPVQVIALAGGKGGVGKTSLSIHLSAAMAAAGRRVVLLDGDTGLGNVADYLTLAAGPTLLDVLEGGATLRDCLQRRAGFRVLPARFEGAGRELMASQQAGLIRGLSALRGDLDTLIVDTGSGLSGGVLNLVSACRDVVLLTARDRGAIGNARALVESLSRRRGVYRFQVVCNMARSSRDGRAAFHDLATACADMEAALHDLGHVPWDDNLRKAAERRATLQEYAPRSRVAQSIEALAERLMALPASEAPSGHLEFFLEDLIRDSA